MTRPRFEPLELLAVLEEHNVAYVVIGKLAGIIHGTGGITDRLEICPQMKDANLARLRRAFAELGIREDVDLAVGELAESASVTVHAPAGALVLEPEPAGTRNGWDDVRRRARREPLGGGIRAAVASVEDLARIAAAAGLSADAERLRRAIELGRGRGLTR